MVQHHRSSFRSGNGDLSNVRGNCDFYFPSGETWSSEALDSLAVAMANPVAAPGRFRAALAPITVPLLDFTLNDISNPLPVIAEAAETGAAPAVRIGNLHSGRLALECLYGPSPDPISPGGPALGELLLDPDDGAKLAVGRVIEVANFADPSHPRDRAGDLPRMAMLLRDPDRSHTIPEPYKSHLVHDPEAKAAVAVIGDQRNDADLFLAQLHLVFLRFHNFLVDRYRQAGLPSSDRSAYEWACRVNRFHYQWLLMNAVLPSFCDPGIIRRVIWSSAQLHGQLLARHNGAAGKTVPLEFSAAAFRLGPSIRPLAYDWNGTFGRGSGAVRENAPYAALLAMTGRNGAVLSDAVHGRDFGRLPSYWMPEWDRLCGPISEFPDRNTRAINTELSGLSLGDSAGALAHSRHQHEVCEILRNCQTFGLASAQTCLDRLRRPHCAPIEPLRPDQIASGHTGRVVREAGFDRRTPLWFYVLKEAELAEGGQRLGPLGSLLVAETIVGLILRDPDTYWSHPGSMEGRWYPADVAPILGQVVDSIPAMIRAAGLL